MSLRNTLTIKKINVMRARHNAWWHANRCPNCAARRGQPQQAGPAYVQVDPAAMVRAVIDGILADDEKPTDTPLTTPKGVH